jgi:fermentation-respiration switch protein FrsA (DUF1100 family)
VTGSAFTWFDEYEDESRRTGAYAGMLLDFIEGEVDRLGGAALQKIDAADWSARREDVGRRLHRSLGLDPLPSRSPLNARLAGTLEYDGYRIEKIVLEPRSGFLAPTLLYLPTDDAGPLPAVVIAVGHWMRHGKTEEHVQALSIGLARLGFVVLAFDPIGQGERGGHFEAHGNAPLLPLGLSQAGTRVWEIMRAVDYLRGRPEVDGDRIGITGASGGGLATVFAAAADERIAAAIPVCFITSYARFLRVMRGQNFNNVGDLCNQVPGVVSHAEMAGVCGLIHPRPLLIINGLQDPQFPVAGAQEVIDHVRPLYDRVDASRLRLHVVDAGHGYDQSMREAAYGWFLRWLKDLGDGSPVPEPAMQVLPGSAAALRCAMDLAIDSTGAIEALAGQTAARRGIRAGEASIKPTSERSIREALGITSTVGSQGHLVASTHRDGLRAERHLIQPEPGIAVPAHLFEPRDGAAGFTLLLADDGKRSRSLRTHLARELEAGRGSFTIDPRGTGETAPIPPAEMTRATLDGSLDVIHTPNGEHLEFEAASDCLMLGRSLLGQQVQDLSAAIGYLISIRPEARQGIHIIAHGPLSSLRAAFAAVLDSRITAVALDGWPISYASLALASRAGLPMTAYIFDVLRSFDLADVIALLAGRSVCITHPIDGNGSPVDVATVRASYSVTIRRFAEVGGSFEVVDASEASSGLETGRQLA